MPLVTALRERPQYQPQPQPQPYEFPTEAPVALPEPLRQRPAIVALAPANPKGWVVASFNLGVAEPEVEIKLPGLVYQTQATHTREVRFKPEAASAEFRENLDHTLELIRLEIKSAYVEAIAADVVRAAKHDGALCPAKASDMRVNVTVNSESDTMADMRRAKHEVAPATKISVNLPMGLNAKQLNDRLAVMMVASRRAMQRESGLKL